MQREVYIVDNIYSKESLENAFDCIVNTDLEYAELKAEVAILKMQLTSESDEIYLTAQGTAAERAAKSRTTAKYNDLLDRYYTALRRYNILSSERFVSVTYIKFHTYGNMHEIK